MFTVAERKPTKSVLYTEHAAHGCCVACARVTLECARRCRLVLGFHATPSGHLVSPHDNDLQALTTHRVVVEPKTEPEMQLSATWQRTRLGKDCRRLVLPRRASGGSCHIQSPERSRVCLYSWLQRGLWGMSTTRRRRFEYWVLFMVSAKLQRLRSKRLINSTRLSREATDRTALPVSRSACSLVAAGCAAWIWPGGTSANSQSFA